MKVHFLNTLHQIVINDSVTPFTGVWRQVEWFLIRLFKRFPRTVPLSKSKIYVDKTNGPAALVHILGKYDFHNMNLVQEYLTNHPNVWFIDVGANIGVYTLLAAEVRAKVLAIEPHPATYKSLLSNIKNNNYSNVVTVNYAATDKCSVVDFSDYRESAVNRIQAGGILKVKGITIEQLIIQHNIEKFIIKIDTEGHDFQVLRGCHQKLDNCVFIIVEDALNPQLKELVNTKHFFLYYYDHNLKLFSKHWQRRKEDAVYINQDYTTAENMDVVNEFGVEELL